jgi:hypothetical protein
MEERITTMARIKRMTSLVAAKIEVGLVSMKPDMPGLGETGPTKKVSVELTLIVTVCARKM